MQKIVFTVLVLGLASVAGAQDKPEVAEHNGHAHPDPVGGAAVGAVVGALRGAISGAPGGPVGLAAGAVAGAGVGALVGGGIGTAAKVIHDVRHVDRPAPASPGVSDIRGGHKRPERLQRPETGGGGGGSGGGPGGPNKAHTVL